MLIAIAVLVVVVLLACVYAAFCVSSDADDAAEEREAQSCGGMACVWSGVADVDPETAEALRRCQEAHDRLVAHVCGGGS